MNKPQDVFHRIIKKIKTKISFKKIFINHEYFGSDATNWLNVNRHHLADLKIWKKSKMWPRWNNKKKRNEKELKKKWKRNEKEVKKKWKRVEKKIEKKGNRKGK